MEIHSIVEYFKRILINESVSYIFVGRFWIILVACILFFINSLIFKHGCYSTIESYIESKMHCYYVLNIKSKIQEIKNFKIFDVTVWIGKHS